MVLHHLTGKGNMLGEWAHSLPQWAYTLVRDGYLAVSVFFVLSGFVLERSYGDAQWNISTLIAYARARFARIYPVYALSLLLIAPYIAVSTVAGKSWLVADYIFLGLGWTGTLPVSWNTPAWSLSCEMFFYLCFPLALIAFRKLNPRASIAAGVAVCFLPALFWWLGAPPAYKPLIHLADFLLGILAGRAYHALAPRLTGRGYWLTLPATLAIVALMLHPVFIPRILDLNGFLRPFTAMALIGVALTTRGPLAMRIFVYLGKASYALYILHIPLLWSYKRWAPYWFPGLSAGPMALIYLAATVVISAAVYSYVEEPANRFLRASPATSPATSPRNNPSPAHSSAHQLLHSSTPSLF